MTAFEQRIRELIAETLKVASDRITRATDFFNDLEVDSLHLVEVEILLEDTFHVPIEDEDVRSVRTFGEFVDLLQQKYKLA